MNIFGFNIKINRVQPSPVIRSDEVTPAEWVQGKDLNYEQQPNCYLASAYEQVVWVYRAINLLAEQVANIPFLFTHGERGRENLITSGPLLDFYARPHPHINRFQYWELRIIWLMLRGECFRLPVYGIGPDRRRRLERVLIVEPAHFQHIIRDHELIGWRYLGLGPNAPLASQVFLPEEVWFEKLPNPFNFWRGLAPLAAAASASSTDFAAGAFMRGIIENNADTGVIVRTEEHLSPEQEEQITSLLRQRKRKPGMADRPILLNGVKEISRPQLSSSDLQFLENRRFSRSEICSAFGVPEELITSTEHAKYDVMHGARLNFIENRIAPLCRRLEAEEDQVVKSLDPAAEGWFDLDSLPIMQEAWQARLTSARAGFEMGVPFNELNRVLDLGFNPLPWGNQGFVPQTFQLLGEAPAVKKAGHPDSESGREPRPNKLGEAARKVGLAVLCDPRPNTTAPNPLERALRLLSGLPARPSSVLSSEALVAKEDAFLTKEEVKESLKTPNQPPAKPLPKKLRRFWFEQRGRILQRLATDGAFPPGQDLLDVLAESLLLTRALAEVAGASESEVEQLATSFNMETAKALRSQTGESAAAQATRARNYFNAQAGDRLSALERQSVAALERRDREGNAGNSSDAATLPIPSQRSNAPTLARSTIPVRITSADSGSASVLDFISSDETLDRYGEIITASGWQLDHYRKNPVFQNAHQYGDVLFTLGKALITEVRTMEGRSVLFQRIEFATEVNPLARIAFGLYQGGFLNAVSVGFVPIRWENGTATSAFTRKYLAQELLEVSAVSIPANPNALALGLRSGAVARTDVTELLGRVEALTEESAAATCRPGAPTGPLSCAEPNKISSIRADSRSDTRAKGSGNHEAQLLQLARHLRRILG